MIKKQRSGANIVRPTSVKEALSSLGSVNGGLVARVVDEVFGVEQQVEVLGRLREKERLHPILQRVIANILRQEKEEVIS